MTNVLSLEVMDRIRDLRLNLDLSSYFEDIATRLDLTIKDSPLDFDYIGNLY
uniref:Uncharacterized protein n=1 Tax=Lepeophtheirus salmonis TaxID=72036 RepID=A0A0K2V806_LEPSM